MMLEVVRISNLIIGLLEKYPRLLSWDTLWDSYHKFLIRTINSMAMEKEQGTKENPWLLKTPPLSSEFTMHKDIRDGKEILVCTVGKTILHYDYRCLEDLHSMLIKHGDWMELGSADEQKPAKEGTVEAWGRSENNPVRGWYGLKKGLRGRFGMYIPPLMEKLGLAELTHDPKGNKIRAR
jgi:hypothetical protein